MPSSKSYELYYLIKSLTKSEKRAFKLYAKRGSGTQHQFIKLFDLIDVMNELNDQQIIKKMKLDSSGKYSNLKRHLYSQIMNSLRLLSKDKKPNIKIREYIDMAYILYGKGLYLQALNILKTAKQLCSKYGTDLSLLTILEIEKIIHSRHITGLKEKNLEMILQDTRKLSASINDRVMLTNLKMKLHQLYIREGHVKNKEQYLSVEQFFRSGIKKFDYKNLGIMEKIYYCQCFVWYNYIIDNYKDCLKYAKKWVQLFSNSKSIQKRDYNLYLRGFHYLLTSAYNLNDLKTHSHFLNKIEQFRIDHYKKFNKNNKIVSFLYTHTGRLNNTFLCKDFKNGIKKIPRTIKRIKRYQNELDQHKIMVLYYKIAWMYICANDTEKAISFLEWIIAMRRKSIREDIQSYARLMHLMALFDLEDYNSILNILAKYKYYFEKAKEINALQKVAFSYFNKVCTIPILDRKKIHNNFYSELLEIKKNQFEKRAFLYLDIISWLNKYL